METSKPVIAVVEDEYDIAEMLSALLTLLGTTVVYVPSSLQVIEQLQALRPALVILDMQMNPLDGATILQRMRIVDGLARVPVVFFTAMEAVVRQRLPEPAELGAQLVPKPDVGRLLEVVRTTMPSLPQ